MNVKKNNQTREQKIIPPELLKKIRHIEIRSKTLVNDLFSGEYHSVFKGRGMEFSEVREYQHGDDIRSIDWNVTARMGHTYVKKFMEERELTVVLIVDASSSGEFGSQGKFKKEIQAEICALLAFSAIRNNDKVGLLIFTDKVELYIPPKKGITHVLRVIREILHFRPEQKRTNISEAMDFFMKIIRRKCVAFLVSDFLSEGFEKALRLASRKHDLIAIHIVDPLEMELREVGILDFEDAETGERILVDTLHQQYTSSFRKLRSENADDIRLFFSSLNIDCIAIYLKKEKNQLEKSYIEPLMLFFKKRAKKFR